MQENDAMNLVRLLAKRMEALHIKLGWELSSVTALDYIDHIITRLELDPKNVDLMDLKRRAETIIVLATTEYQFSYLSPSLLAASAIYTALKCLSLIRIDLQLGEFKNLKEIRQRIQSATHCIPVSIFQNSNLLNVTKPFNLCREI